ncbi:MAG: YkgJ family cysteine cluster protein [Candidatus Methanoperedens sp.]|nr:YkgJ family cysteine cluster protein [Candidatus Methanoperedens sp.]
MNPKITALQALYSCEGCGRCCRRERVTVSPEDMRRNRRLLGAIDNYVAFGYAVLKLPCKFISEDNRCTCYAARPAPCRLYPIIEKYPEHVTISQCPYGNKIIKDLMEFCELNGIPTEDATAKENIMKMDQMYRDMGLGQEESFPAVSIPMLVFNEFYGWIKIRKQGDDEK